MKLINGDILYNGFSCGAYRFNEKTGMFEASVWYLGPGGMSVEHYAGKTEEELSANINEDFS